MSIPIRTLAAWTIASALVAGKAQAEVEYQVHTGYTSEYIFRGINLGQDLVEAGAGVAGEYRGFSLAASAWYASFDNGGQDFDELDLSTSASYTWNAVTGTVGYIWYNNLRQLGADQQEIFASASTSIYGFDASFTYFWDIELDNDGYSELAIGHGWELSPCLTLNASGILAYLFEQGELAHATAKISLDYQFRENATISPFVAHSWALTEDGGYAGSDNELIGGVRLAVAF